MSRVKVNYYYLAANGQVWTCPRRRTSAGQWAGAAVAAVAFVLMLLVLHGQTQTQQVTSRGSTPVSIRSN